GLVQDILFEINVGNEDSKMGAAAEDLWPLLEQAAALNSVRVRGLMSIPPSFDNSPESRRWFALTREMLEQARQRHPQLDRLDTLSMGMSDSFEAAILEGATLVRVGSSLYGMRY
ncbi:MAG: YggS family pyridoxal phosphate-dependent enzyme, partial [Clostridiales bacterium]|nr:YggS family pyridoxal phosphate-dependent enzyme [Clostridiales bacterium]